MPAVQHDHKNQCGLNPSQYLTGKTVLDPACQKHIFLKGVMGSQTPQIHLVTLWNNDKTDKRKLYTHWIKISNTIMKIWRYWFQDKIDSEYKMIKACFRINYTMVWEKEIHWIAITSIKNKTQHQAIRIPLSNDDLCKIIVLPSL